MQNRRDQVQAHAFVVGRLVSALLRAEPDAPMTPLRRFVVGTFWGALLGALAVAGFGVYGFISPGGSTAWRAGGALIVEKETGARYVFVEGELRPVVNYASARLIVGKAPTIVRVSRKSLRGVPHGLAVGIAGAPDYLPDPASLDARQWRVCSTTRPDATGAKRPFVTVRAGRTSDRLARPAGPGEAMLVKTPAGQLYLAWNNQRLLLGTPGVLVALGYSAVPQREVGWAWINALPAGPDLAGANIADRGTAGPAVNGRPGLIGQLFRVVADTTVPAQHFVLRRDGLSPLTPLGAALLLTDPRTRAAYPDGRIAEQQLTSAALAQAPRSAVSSVNPALPEQPPQPMAIGPGEAPCLQLTMADGGPEVLAGADAEAEVTAAGVAGGDPTRADRVEVRAGTGLLVRELPAPQVADGALFLLADNGVRYPIPDQQTAGVLGYGGVTATPVPALILALVPTGRPLDRDAARATTPPAGEPAGASPTGERRSGTG